MWYGRPYPARYLHRPPPPSPPALYNSQPPHFSATYRPVPVSPRRSITPPHISQGFRNTDASKQVKGTDDDTFGLTLSAHSYSRDRDLQGAQTSLRQANAYQQDILTSGLATSTRQVRPSVIGSFEPKSGLTFERLRAHERNHAPSNYWGVFPEIRRPRSEDDESSVYSGSNVRAHVGSVTWEKSEGVQPSRYSWLLDLMYYYPQPLSSLQAVAAWGSRSICHF